MLQHHTLTGEEPRSCILLPVTIFPCLYLVLQGIGKATAILLAECGANVIALSRTQSDLDSLKTQVKTLENTCMRMHNAQWLPYFIQGYLLVYIPVCNMFQMTAHRLSNCIQKWVLVGVKI